MNTRISKIKNDIQNRESLAWGKLCEYVDVVHEKKLEEFSPYEFLGKELYFQIFTLPKSISKLKNVKTLNLYGSKLKRIPPEIGQMESLEKFIPYTSYDLHWFPYEIIDCTKLVNSTVSSRAIYGNYKKTMMFPRLDHNPVKYQTLKINCSHCKKEIHQNEVEQYWISLLVGTDVLPLLANLCSESCKNSLPKPPDNYFQFPHKGGAKMGFPNIDSQDYVNAIRKIQN